MTQEDKELLLKDLSARLPYGVICHYTRKFIDTEIGDGKIRSIYVEDCLETDFVGIVINHTETGLGYIKPYLRPMSSMTEEEKKELSHLLPKDWSVEIDKLNNFYFDMSPSIFMEIDVFLNIIDWLNTHHFDYRGLIDKGLALKAPEGMYNIKEK